jgi:hypothetical protein
MYGCDVWMRHMDARHAMDARLARTYAVWRAITWNN